MHYILEEFVAYKLPNSKEVRCFKGNWENKEIANLANHFWFNPFSNLNVAVALNLNKPCKLEELSLKTSLTNFTAFNEIETQTDFENRVEGILNKIDKSYFKKVVPARTNFFALETINIKKAFLQACNLQEHAFCYLMYHKQYGLWMGASPELFLKFANQTGATTALAGTILANTTGFTKKEENEQEIVVSQILNTLHKLNIKGNVMQNEIAKSGNLQHIKTDIEFNCEFDFVPNVLKALHPSAAVGGFPRKEALNWLQNTEKLNRNLYTGWFGLNKNNTWKSHVNLRCAQIFKNGIYCYAGCGVSEGSNASLEWEETNNKMQIIRSFF